MHVYKKIEIISSFSFFLILNLSWSKIDDQGTNLVIARVWSINPWRIEIVAVILNLELKNNKMELFGAQEKMRNQVRKKEYGLRASLGKWWNDQLTKRYKRQTRNDKREKNNKLIVALC